MTASIIEGKKECYFCRILANVEGYYGELPSKGLHRHHIMYGMGRRALSERYGLWIWLCYHHHNDPSLNRDGVAESVHFNRTLRRQTERIAQRAFETKGSRDDWVSIFGRNYLD